MARIPCEVATTTRENESGYEVEAICATCLRCDHETEAFGTSDASIRRALAKMRDECPKGERNWYVPEGSDDEEFG